MQHATDVQRPLLDRNPLTIPHPWCGNNNCDGEVDALPEGEGATLSLGSGGDLGFKAERGYLRLTVPLPVAGWGRERLGSTIVHESTEGLSLDRAARVADFWIRLTPGMRAAIPLGLLGELRIEAA